MMMYQMCFTFGSAGAAVVFVAAVAEGVRDAMPNTREAAITTDIATRELLLVACEMERREFMNFVMT